MREIWKTAPLFAAVLPPMKVQEKRVVRWHFADLADLPMVENMPAEAWCDTAWNDEAQRGTRDMREAIALARGGWAEGAEQARALRDGIEATRPRVMKMARYDVAGAVPCVARAIAGNPMAMRRMVMRESARMPTLTLICDISVSWRFPAEEMIKQAAATAAVVDLLEDGGYRCEVIVVARAGRHGVGAEIAVCLKRAGDVCNLSALAYGLGHAATFRRLFFAVLFCDASVMALGEGLGHVERCNAAAELGTFTVPSGSAIDDGRCAAIDRFKAICRSLRGQGCPGIPESVR